MFNHLTLSIEDEKRLMDLEDGFSLPEGTEPGFTLPEEAEVGLAALADSANGSRLQASGEAGQDVRRPRTPSGGTEEQPPSDSQQAKRAGVSPVEMPGVFGSPKVREASRRIKAAAGETYFPMVLSGAQIELVKTALSDAFDDAMKAMRKEPHGKDEIQPYADAYNELLRLFIAAKAAKACPNENWRGMGVL